MTALGRYAKLEAIGRYLDGRSGAAREVVVSFGERSLVIMGLDDRAIAHWPLASLRALAAPAEGPVELAPDPASAERLLLDDGEMSAAIAEVCPDLHRAPPARPRRRRSRALAAGVAAVLLAAGMAAAVSVLPDRLVELIPPGRAEALGEAMAARLPALLDPADPPALCVAGEGLAALGALVERLGPTDPPLRVTVIDAARRDALALPGGRVVLFRGLLEAARAPEEVAGVLAHAVGHAARRDPLRAVIDGAGAAGLATLLVGGIEEAADLADTATALEGAYPPETEARADATAFALLAAAGLPSTPYAALAGRLAGDGARRGGADAGAPKVAATRATETAKGKTNPPPYSTRHPWGEPRARAADAADTIGAAPFRPALRDRDWIALGTICDRRQAARPGLQ